MSQIYNKREMDMAQELCQLSGTTVAEETNIQRMDTALSSLYRAVNELEEFVRAFRDESEDIEERAKEPALTICSLLNSGPNIVSRQAERIYAAIDSIREIL